MDPTHPTDVPRARLPRWLDGLLLPCTQDEALEVAERNGASARALEYLEALPAAVFTSEDGLHHALDGVDEDRASVDHLPRGSIAHDGPAS